MNSYFFLAVYRKPIERNEIREKVLARLISMTVQLKYLLIEQFEWLLHVVQYVRMTLIRGLLLSRGSSGPLPVPAQHLTIR